MFELTDDQRQAIALTKYVGMTTYEASSILGVTETTLKARLKRGLDKIKKQWQVEETNQ
jgi:DNA-directed RNA polymerase specialized sigma24 family protein